MLLDHSRAYIETLFAHDIFKSVDTSLFDDRIELLNDICAFNSLHKQDDMKELESFIIESIPTNGLKLTKAGNYSFAHDLVWKPQKDGAAITIEHSNITLDLNGFTLKIDNKDATRQIVGIHVAHPTTNLILFQLHHAVEHTLIKNGRILGSGKSGVLAEYVSNIRLENLRIEKIRYVNLKTKNASPAGIHITHAENLELVKCTVSDLQVTSSSCAGIQLIETKNGTITDCTMENFVNEDGSTQGYSYIFSSYLNSKGCKARNFKSHYKGKTKTLGHTVIGYCPWLASQLTFENCTAIGMTGCCDDCHGMSIFLASHVKVINFEARDILDGAGPAETGAKATGLEVYGIDVHVSNSRVENIKAIVPQDLQSTGFSAWGADITFTNCTATEVHVIDPKLIPNTKYGYGTGFGWAPDPRVEFRMIPAYKVTYDACKAVNCQVAFDTWYHVDSLWKDNIDEDKCGISILVQEYGQRTLRGDKCSECPKPFSVKLTNMAKGNSYPDLD